MILPALRLPFLRDWPAAPDIKNGLRGLLIDKALCLPAILNETEREEIVDLLALFLELPVCIVARPEEARSGELCIVTSPVDRDPGPVRDGVLVCIRRHVSGDRRIGAPLELRQLRDAIIQSLGRHYSGTRLQRVASWTGWVADSPSTALRFASGALAQYTNDPGADDAALYIAGLVETIAWLLRGVDTRVAQWAVAKATGAPHPGRLVSSEALLLGEDAALQRAFLAGLVETLTDENGNQLYLRRPLLLLGRLDTGQVRVSLRDVAAALGPVLDPEIRLVFDRLLRLDRRRLDLEGPKPVSGFVDRDEVIQRLIALFDPADAIRTTVLHGIDGIGKTQVAAALCEVLATRFEPVWVRFTEGAEAGWLRVAGALGVDPNRPGAMTRDRSGVPQWVHLVHQELRFRSCLIVAEGVDVMPEDDLVAWLPSGEGTSAVLVLSRSAQRPLQRAHDAIAVRLAGLGREQSRRLLIGKAPHLRSEILRGNADKLIDQVGGHPGALSISTSLFEHRSLEDVTLAVRRGEQAIPEILKEVVGALNEAETATLAALAVSATGGSLPELVLKIVARDDGRQALNRLLDRSLAMNSGRMVRLHEVVRLEEERLLNQNPTALHTLEQAHARRTSEMLAEAITQGDVTTQDDLHLDLILIAERLTAWYQAGAPDTMRTLANLARLLLLNPRGEQTINAKHAIEAYRTLAAVDSTNTEWQQGLISGHNKAGNALLIQGDTEGSLKEFRSTLDILERLIQSEPNKTQWQSERWASHIQIGYVLFVQGANLGALEAYRTGLSIAEHLAQQEPADIQKQLNLCASYSHIGQALSAQGNDAEALDAYRAQLAILNILIQKDSSNLYWQRERGVAHNRIGHLLLGQDNEQGALEAFQVDLTIAEALAQKNPSNLDWQHDLAVAHNSVGAVLLRQGDYVGALSAFQADFAIANRLAQGNPRNTIWQASLASSYKKIADTLRAQGDNLGAISAFHAALAIRERLVRQDPANAKWATMLAGCQWKLAAVLIDGTSDERAEARALLDRARRILLDLALTSRLSHDEQNWLPQIETIRATYNKS